MSIKYTRAAHILHAKTIKLTSFRFTCITGACSPYFNCKSLSIIRFLLQQFDDIFEPYRIKSSDVVKIPPISSVDTIIEMMCLSTCCNVQNIRCIRWIQSYLIAKTLVFAVSHWRIATVFIEFICRQLFGCKFSYSFAVHKLCGLEMRRFVFFFLSLFLSLHTLCCNHHYKIILAHKTARRIRSRWIATYTQHHMIGLRNCVEL